MREEGGGDGVGICSLRVLLDLKGNQPTNEGLPPLPPYPTLFLSGGSWHAGTSMID